LKAFLHAHQSKCRENFVRFLFPISDKKRDSHLEAMDDPLDQDQQHNQSPNPVQSTEIEVQETEADVGNSIDEAEPSIMEHDTNQQDIQMTERVNTDEDSPAAESTSETNGFETGQIDSWKEAQEKFAVAIQLFETRIQNEIQPLWRSISERAIEYKQAAAATAAEVDLDLNEKLEATTAFKLSFQSGGCESASSRKRKAQAK
jgi:hypothetical protein